MNVRDLLQHWARQPGERYAPQQYCMHLSERDAARITALSELFPGKSREALVGELLAAALDELEAAMPYVPGKRVIAEDEVGDPMYEDAGMTPRFLELTRKHLERLHGRNG
jgi:hypothetical protein